MQELLDEMLDAKESLLESKLMLPRLEEDIEKCKSKMNQIKQDEQNTTGGATSKESSSDEEQTTVTPNAEYAAAEAELAAITKERDQLLEVQRFCELRKIKFQMYKKMADQAQQRETIAYSA